MKKVIILIGGPGSGKGTQAKKIASKYNYGHISTGDLLRALDSDPDGDKTEKQALTDMKNGKLVADWLIYRLAFREINKYLDNNQGVVLDGAIRNVEQAQKYQEYFQDKNVVNEVLAIEIVLSDEEFFNRLTKRRVCNDCKEIIPYLKSTQDLKVCPKCNGELVVRKDDSEEIIRQRIIDQGNASLKPILDYYADLNVLKKIDGSMSIEDVEKKIEMILG